MMEKAKKVAKSFVTPILTCVVIFSFAYVVGGGQRNLVDRVDSNTAKTAQIISIIQHNTQERVDEHEAFLCIIASSPDLNKKLVDACLEANGLHSNYHLP